MISLIFFLFVIALSIAQTFYKKEFSIKEFFKYLMDNIFLISIGLFSIFSASGHIFMGPEIAKQIGWPPNNPFQFEVGIANLSYGILGLIAYKLKNSTRLITLIGWSIFLIGAFVGHLIQAYVHKDFAPYNFGIFIWFNDLILPSLALLLYFYTQKASKQ